MPSSHARRQRREKQQHQQPPAEQLPMEQVLRSMQEDPDLERLSAKFKVAPDVLREALVLLGVPPPIDPGSVDFTKPPRGLELPQQWFLGSKPPQRGKTVYLTAPMDAHVSEFVTRHRVSFNRLVAAMARVLIREEGELAAATAARKARTGESESVFPAPFYAAVAAELDLMKTESGAG